MNQPKERAIFADSSVNNVEEVNANFNKPLSSTANRFSKTPGFPKVITQPYQRPLIETKSLPFQRVTQSLQLNPQHQIDSLVSVSWNTDVIPCANLHKRKNDDPTETYK